MKINKTVFICAGIILLLLLAFFLIQHSSLKLSLLFHKLDTSSVHYIEKKVTTEEETYCVVQTKTTSGDWALVYAKLTPLGFWTITNIQSGRDFSALEWSQPAGVRRYDYKENPVFERKWNYVCCGSDAVGNIQIPDDQLPPNATVQIRQTGSVYLIRIIYFSEDPFSEIDIHTVISSVDNK